jgi:predicted O-methyltransferase YrrM
LQGVVNQHFETIDFVFIDANHKYDAVIQYFNVILPKLTENSIVVFDDIYWSDGMTQAWNEIKNYPQVVATIDLFHIGIVFFNKNLTKKNYKMRA